MPTPLPLPTSDTLFEYSYYPIPDENYNPDPENLPIIQLSKSIKYSHPLIKNSFYKTGPSIQLLRTLTLDVSENNIKRSLLLYDTIFKEVEKRGCQITIGQSRYENIPFVVKDDLSIPINLFENKTPNYWIDSKYSTIKDQEPKYTGLLSCILYYRVRQIKKEFIENNTHKMEDFLPEIINNIILGFEIKRQFEAYILKNKNIRERFNLSSILSQ